MINTITTTQDIAAAHDKMMATKSLDEFLDARTEWEEVITMLAF